MRFSWKLGVLAAALLTALACTVRHSDYEGSLRVFNDGTVTMDRLYVTPSESDTWGADQLASYPLRPSDSITLTRLYPGYYDVKARFSDGSTDTVYDVRIHDGGTATLGMQNSGNGAVAVVNDSGLSITGVYLTPANSTTWGPNQADGPIPPGQSLTLTGVEPDVYDLHVVYSTTATATYKGFTVTAGLTYTLHVN